MNYKDKGKNSCYIVEKEHTKTSFDDDKEIIEMVYVAIKEDPNYECYESENSLISHVSKNDSWMIDSGCSHHIIDDLGKLDKLKEIEDGRIFSFGNNVPYSINLIYAWVVQS